MLLIDLIFLYQPFVKNPIVGCLFSSTYEEQLNPFLQFQFFYLTKDNTFYSWGHAFVIYCKKWSKYRSDQVKQIRIVKMFEIDVV